MSHDTEVRRLLQRLRLLIYLSHLNQRRVEERAGFSKGYLSQLLCGNIDLKYHHVITILRAAEIDPSAFFADLYPRRPNALLQTADGLHRPATPIDQPLHLKLAKLYGMGLESMDDLAERLERCELAFSELEAMGVLDGNPQ